MTSTIDLDAEARIARYQSVRADTERLADPLSPEDQAIQSMPDVSPTKWHRAHTTWFFETFLLEPSLPGYRVHDPAYAYLFNSYYDAVGPRHARNERGLISRPSVDDIARYRAAVDEAMATLLDRPSSLPAAQAFLVELGMQHEQQHQELLLMDIKHVLSRNPLLPAYVRGAPHPRAAGAGAGGWREHGGGLVDVGHPSGAGFAFDNESPRHTVHLAPFTLAGRPVSCGEWKAFVADGGYERVDLWLSEGWATAKAAGWEAPLYWSRDGDGWAVFTLEGARPVADDEPVCHVSYFEADAFARWAGARLPTEFEWEAAAPTGAGQVWEWTSSAYAAYPGFRTADGAVGEYNGKFMVNQYVLRGGCCATPAGHARPTYRNFYPASSQWAFSGVRLARDVDPS